MLKLFLFLPEFFKFVFGKTEALRLAEVIYPNSLRAALQGRLKLNRVELNTRKSKIFK